MSKKPSTLFQDFVEGMALAEQGKAMPVSSPDILTPYEDYILANYRQQTTTQIANHLGIERARALEIAWGLVKRGLLQLT